MTKYVEWEEPYCQDPMIHCVIRITVDEVIKLQHSKAAKLGHKYDNDDDALEDFLVVYWAWIKEYDE